MRRAISGAATGKGAEHAAAAHLWGKPCGMLTDNFRTPHQRPLWVYLPAGYDDEPGRRYSTIYLIQGLTGQLDMWRNRPPLRKNFPELADELFAKGEAPPCILVWVDCWTSLGGSQFLDSPATGRYHTCVRRLCFG